jgi:hypothetical protein
MQTDVCEPNLREIAFGIFSQYRAKYRDGLILRVERFDQQCPKPQSVLNAVSLGDPPFDFMLRLDVGFFGTAVMHDADY